VVLLACGAAILGARLADYKSRLHFVNYVNQISQTIEKEREADPFSIAALQDWFSKGMDHDEMSMDPDEAHRLSTTSATHEKATDLLTKSMSNSKSFKGAKCLRESITGANSSKAKVVTGQVKRVSSLLSNDRANGNFNLATRFYEMEVDLSMLEDKEKIGAGAAGNVYRASYLGETIALKTLYQQKDMNFEDFSHEVSLLSHISHPCIVRFYGIGKERLGDTLNISIVTEFCPYSLDSLVRQQQEAGTIHRVVEKGMQFSLQIADGMEYLHRLDTLHLDLKPANVLLTSNWTCKLCDFGVSQKLRMSRDPGDNSVKKLSVEIHGGTDGFLAPEAAGGKITCVLENARKVDVFAFAVTVACIYSGNQPFPEELSGTRNTQGALYQRALSEQTRIAGCQAKFPTESCAEFPPVFSQLLSNCRSINPKERPSFRQIKRDIKCVMALRSRDQEGNSNGVIVQ